MLRILTTALLAASIAGSSAQAETTIGNRIFYRNHSEVQPYFGKSKTIWKDVTYQEHGNLSYGTDGSVQRLDTFEVLVKPPAHPKREHGNRVCLMYADHIACSK